MNSFQNHERKVWLLIAITLTAVVLICVTLNRMFFEVRNTDVSAASTSKFGRENPKWGYFDPEEILVRHSVFSLRRQEIVNTILFHDSVFERDWPVPSGATVDGASIPEVLWSFIGGPYEGLYRVPSYIHDFYCDTKLRPWREVHMTFYTSMMAAGMDDLKAKIMWSGVRYFGPRWKSLDELGNCLEDCGDNDSIPTRFNEKWFKNYITWIKRHEEDEFSWSPNVFDLESLALLCDIARDGVGSVARKRLVEEDSILTHPNFQGRPLATRIGEPFADVFVGEFLQIGCPTGSIDAVFRGRNQIKRLSKP